MLFGYALNKNDEEETLDLFTKHLNTSYLPGDIALFIDEYINTEKSDEPHGLDIIYDMAFSDFYRKCDKRKLKKLENGLFSQCVELNASFDIIFHHASFKNAQKFPVSVKYGSISLDFEICADSFYRNAFDFYLKALKNYFNDYLKKNADIVDKIYSESEKSSKPVSRENILLHLYNPHAVGYLIKYLINHPSLSDINFTGAEFMNDRNGELNARFFINQDAYDTYNILKETLTCMEYKNSFTTSLIIGNIYPDYFLPSKSASREERIKFIDALCRTCKNCMDETLGCMKIYTHPLSAYFEKISEFTNADTRYHLGLDKGGELDVSDIVRFEINPGKILIYRTALDFTDNDEFISDNIKYIRTVNENGTVLNVFEYEFDFIKRDEEKQLNRLYSYKTEDNPFHALMKKVLVNAIPNLSLKYDAGDKLSIIRMLENSSLKSDARSERATDDYMDLFCSSFINASFHKSYAIYKCECSRLFKKRSNSSKRCKICQKEIDDNRFRKNLKKTYSDRLSNLKKTITELSDDFETLFNSRNRFKPKDEEKDLRSFVYFSWMLIIYDRFIDIKDVIDYEWLNDSFKISRHEIGIGSCDNKTEVSRADSFRNDRKSLIGTESLFYLTLPKHGKDGWILEEKPYSIKDLYYELCALAKKHVNSPLAKKISESEELEAFIGKFISLNDGLSGIKTGSPSDSPTANTNDRLADSKNDVLTDSLDDTKATTHIRRR